MRRRTPLILTAAIVLAACGADDDTNGADTAPDEQSAPDAPDGEAPDGGQPDGDPDGDPLAPDDQAMDLLDPNEMVEDGVFRGEGIVLPAPEGWTFDEMALAQQGVVAAATEDNLEQLAGQAIDTEDVPDEVDGEELTVDALIETNRDQLPGDPTVDESVEIEGAEQAHQLQFEDVDPQVEGQPPSSIQLIVADDGDGRIAIFNYVAGSDDYDASTADLLLDTAGFDPESDPTPPAPMPAPEGDAPQLDDEELPELDEDQLEDELGEDELPEFDEAPDADGDADVPDQG